MYWHVQSIAVEAIITFNLKDFPDDMLSQYDIRAIHPDEFLSDMLAMSPGDVVQAARRHRSSLKSPPFNVDQYLGLLFNQRLPETVNGLDRYKFMI